MMKLTSEVVVFPLILLVGCALWAKGRLGESECKSIWANESSDEWPTMQGNPQRFGFSADKQLRPPLELVWHFPIEKEANSPIVSNCKVFFGCGDGNYYALDADTGELKWSTKTGEHIGNCGVVYDGAVYVGSSDGYLYAFNQESGRILWKYKTGVRPKPYEERKDVTHGVDGAPVIYEGKVIFGAWDAHVHAVDVKKGSLIWKTRLGGPVHWCSPGLGKGRVYIGSTDGCAYCIDAGDGKVVWKKRIGVESLDGMMCGPTYYEGRVILGSGYSGPEPMKEFSRNYDSATVALNPDTGEELWSLSGIGPVIGSAAIAEGLAYIFPQNGTVCALEPATGKIVWKTKIGAWSGCSLAIANGFLYGGSKTGEEYLFALDIRTGEIAWKSNDYGQTWTSPCIARGKVYFGTDKGLYVFKSK